METNDTMVKLYTPVTPDKWSCGGEVITKQMDEGKKNSLPEYWKRGGVSLEEFSFRWSLFRFPETKFRSGTCRVRRGSSVHLLDHAKCSGIREASKTLQESSESDAKRWRRKISLERRERDKEARVSQIERDSTLVLCLKGGDCGFGFSQTPNGLRVPRPNSFRNLHERVKPKSQPKEVTRDNETQRFRVIRKRMRLL
ncbi:hypothetical protein DY000_02059136 [Brassica cretica]|uniref:Uncharacterized protein n=1 Tax=Brassica cretica TaxID=69181 RepID=A0ABQ7APX6_BRACR|nr:hypothetical protein DY000_02059136 [Brassica cretica]